MGTTWVNGTDVVETTAWSAYLWKIEKCRGKRRFEKFSSNITKSYSDDSAKNGMKKSLK